MRDLTLHRYIGRNNVDHCLSLLGSNGLTPQERTMIVKRLIAEEDKLGRDLEHIDFAETRAAKGRERVNRVRKSRKAFDLGTRERELAERLLVHLENRQTMWEDFCHRLREKVKSRGI